MTGPKPLPLLWRTPDAWAAQVLQSPLELLSDQAYLEKKAANNALEFLNLWPSAQAPPHWLSSLAAIARDETQHLQMVVRLLEKRGGQLARSHKTPYATELRGLVRKGKGSEELADRLLVSGLIEARSCERFECLAGQEQDAELSGFFRGLTASENGHYQLFLDMAQKTQPKAAVQKRWKELLELEAAIIQAQPPGPRIHSGLG
ncbi:MAG TPA: tRNA isopentenyl-2-thiomethyl-A-37 hydroxylase MiaE [bacterium]|nr:tRNA isopentenyl-2-thiomethyl-A-37 hydroxylase MiaE [bacterium]